MALPKGSTSGETQSSQSDDEGAMLAFVQATRKELAKKQKNKMNLLSSRAEKVIESHTNLISNELNQFQNFSKTRSITRDNQAAEIEAELMDLRGKLTKELKYRGDLGKKAAIAIKHESEQIEKVLLEGMKKVHSLGAKEQQVLELIQNLWEGSEVEESEEE